MTKDREIIKPLFFCVLVLLVLSLIPVFLCAFFDYATGDDLGKSAAVHLAMKDGKSFIEIFKIAVSSAYEVWRTHEGTWASNFILEFQPGIWGERVYTITPFIGVAFLSVGMCSFLHMVIIEFFEFKRSVYLFVISLVLILAIQYMPYIRGGLFWYTGMAHYVIPFAMALIYIVWIKKLLFDDKSGYGIWIILDGIYLGGSHYQAILLALLLLPIIIVMCLLKKEKIVGSKPKIITISVVLMIIGFYFCATAPGNAQRAGEEFSFGISRAIETIIKSITTSTVEGIGYLLNSRIQLIYGILVLAIGITAGNIRNKKRIMLYIAAMVYSYLVYCAMYAPGIYYSTFEAEEGISGGYFDVNYFSFLLMLTVIMMLIGKIIGSYISFLDAPVTFHLFLAVSSALLLVFIKPVIKTSNDYICVEYIRSGQLADFHDQMQERLAILQDGTIKEVVLPEMNDQQGPFMHMQLTNDPESFTNMVTAKYYGKNSVIAIPRDQWND